MLGKQCQSFERVVRSAGNETECNIFSEIWGPGIRISYSGRWAERKWPVPKGTVKEKFSPYSQRNIDLGFAEAKRLTDSSGSKSGFIKEK